MELCGAEVVQKHKGNGLRMKTFIFFLLPCNMVYLVSCDLCQDKVCSINKKREKVKLVMKCNDNKK